MGGFLNLVEAFLAFALTMLALSTAVSAIVEVGYNLFRWRAKGLRDMVAYVFRNTIRPLWKDALSTTEAAAKNWTDARIEFILEVSMAPNPQHGTSEDEDVRKRQIETAEKYEGILMRDWGKRFAVPLNLLYRFLNWPLRLFFLWPSLKYGLTNLPADDFKARFETSTAGEAIKKAHLFAWQENCKTAVEAFNAQEGAATERFRRKSRYFSIIVGFALAFAVNVDSFDLLNSYLTDADLREAVIARADTYLDQAERGVQPEGQQNAAAPSTAFEMQIDRIVQTLEGVQESGLLDDQLQTHVAQALTLANESKATAADLQQEVTNTAQAVRGIAGNLTESFPIGWNRYPQCPENTSDARCLTLTAAQHNPMLDATKGWPHWHIPEVPAQAVGQTETLLKSIGRFFWWLGWGITGIIMWPVECLVWAYRYLGVFYMNDPPGFFRWLFGVVTTGILVGLGSPFWVRVVNKLLETRKVLKSSQTLSEETPTPQGPAPQPATQPTTAPPASPQTTLDRQKALIQARMVADEALKQKAGG